MTANYSGARYSRPLIVLHWFTLLLLVGVYGFIEARELFEKGTDVRELIKTMHFMLGLTLLLTVMLRLLYRLRSKTPPIEPAPHWLMHRAAQLVHVLLYGLMIGMPIAGWMILSAAGKPVPFYGLELPALVAENKDLADTIKATHKTIGNLGYFLIAIHALAGVYHHHVRRDNTLLRMLPGGKN